MIEENFPEQLMNKVHILKSVINVLQEMIKDLFPGQVFMSVFIPLTHSPYGQ